MKTILKFGALGLATGMLFSQCGPQKTDTVEEVEETVQVEEIKAPTLTMLWETEANLTTCESVLYDGASDKIFVSNIGGPDPQAKDGKGSISVIDKNGKIVTQDWVTGLNAPKGMGVSDGKLFVTDIDQVVEIDIASAAITKRHPVTGAKFLNDLDTHQGKVYFTDMNTGKVHLLDNGKISVLSEGHESINGIAVAENGTIYGLDASGLKVWNADGTASVVNPNVTGGDGLIILEDDNFIASRWQGEIWFANKDGQTLLLDTKASESNTADIGFIPGDNIILVPTFFKNKVVAYKLDY